MDQWVLCILPLLVVLLRASQGARGLDTGTAGTVRMHFFSGIQVTETLVGIAEVRDRKT
jgi:hypothetical protein